MSKKKEWVEDSESLSIAMDILDKYSETFDGIDLSKIRFVRILGNKKGKDVKVHSVGFPMNIDCPYLYYIEIDDNKWKMMDDAKRNLTVFSGLYEISPGGMDPESINYGKKRPMDIKDYSAVICAAGGRYDWKEEGSKGIHDILLEDNSKDEINKSFSDENDAEFLKKLDEDEVL
jgi:hypothetical protein